MAKSHYRFASVQIIHLVTQLTCSVHPAQYAVNTDRLLPQITSTTQSYK